MASFPGFLRHENVQTSLVPRPCQSLGMRLVANLLEDALLKKNRILLNASNLVQCTLFAQFLGLPHLQLLIVCNMGDSK